jgi:hypothetical protein
MYIFREDNILAAVRTISFASGSKFPSGGQCAGYCRKKKQRPLMERMHLKLCYNEATDLQYEILKQMPSMNQRIQEA